jgi:peptide/nickel transport system substrate-binding protein
MKRRTKNVVRFLALATIFCMMIGVMAGCKPATQAQPKLVRFMLANTPNMDPAVGSDEASSAAFVNLYDSLVFPQPGGTVSLSLATAYRVSDDGLVWEFDLRQGVKFHSGNELTAEDVAFSMTRLTEIGEGFGYLFKGKVKTSEAPSPYTVRFTLSEPFGPFLATLVRLYVVDKKTVVTNEVAGGSYGANGDYGKAWLQSHDAGSGPYTVADFQQDQYLLASRFNDYWGEFDPNNPDQFKLLSSSDPVTVKTMISRRELEITGPYEPIENYTAMDAVEGVDVGKFAVGSLMSLTLNNQVAPTDDLHFRKAVALAIDYATMVDKIYPGSKKAASVVSRVVAGYNPNASSFAQDKEKALAELKQSKYYSQLSKYPLDVAWIAETPDREKLALLIQANLTEIGITVNVVKLPWLSLVDGSTKPETTPVSATVMTAPDYSEAGSQLVARFRSKPVGSWERCEWVNDPQIDAAIDAAIATTDQPSRLRKYQDIQKTLMDNCVTVPLFDQVDRMAYQSAYVTWASADAAAQGQPVVAVMGYLWYMRNIKVYPDKIPH